MTGSNAVKNAKANAIINGSPKIQNNILFIVPKKRRKNKETKALKRRIIS